MFLDTSNLLIIKKIKTSEKHRKSGLFFRFKTEKNSYTQPNIFFDPKLILFRNVFVV